MTESSNGLEGASGFTTESVSVTRHVTKVTVAKAELELVHKDGMLFSAILKIPGKVFMRLNRNWIKTCRIQFQSHNNKTINRLNAQRGHGLCSLHAAVRFLWALGMFLVVVWAQWDPRGLAPSPAPTLPPSSIAHLQTELPSCLTTKMLRPPITVLARLIHRSGRKPN